MPLYRTGSQEIHFHTAGCLQVPMTQLSKGGPSHSCACFAYPCNVLKALVEVRLYSSGILCLRQNFQQLIIWKEVEPTNTDRGMRRGCLLQQQGLSPSRMGNKPFAKDTVSDCSLISLFLCRWAATIQPSLFLLPLQKSVISKQRGFKWE